MSGWLTNGFPAAVLPLTGNERIPVDTNNAQGITPESEYLTTSQLATSYGSLPAWVTGRFYGLPLGASQTTFLTVTGTLYAYPIFVPSPVSLKSLNLSVTTGQTGGAAHIGLYADNGAGYPGALVAGSDPATVAATATAVVSNAFTTITLNPGIYWAASIFTATGTFPTVEGISAVYTGVVGNSIGYDTAAHALAGTGQAVTGISVAQTYGSLPAAFPAAATVTLNTATPSIAIGV